MSSDFVHLHLHTQYSLLDGANRTKDLIEHVLKSGMSAMAVTDHGNMFGAFDIQMELPRMREALERIQVQRKVLKDPGKFTPFAFPIIVDRLREKLGSEQLEDRIRKMTERLEKG